MPHGPPEMLLPTTFAFADFWPTTTVPTKPERLISLERIFVPGESTTSTPTQLPTRSFPRDSGIEAFDSLDRELVFRVASDNILHDRGARTGLDNDGIVVGFGARAAYKMVLRHSGVDAPGNADIDTEHAYDTVSHNSSVTSVGNVDP